MLSNAFLKSRKKALANGNYFVGFGLVESEIFQWSQSQKFKIRKDGVGV
jgi:hypothetical protein